MQQAAQLVKFDLFLAALFAIMLIGLLIQGFRKKTIPMPDTRQVLNIIKFFIFNAYDSVSYVSHEREAKKDLATINAMIREAAGDAAEEAVFQDWEEIYDMLPDLPRHYYNGSHGDYCRYYVYLRLVSLGYGISAFPAITTYSAIPDFCTRLEEAISYAEEQGMSQEEIRWKIELYLSVRSNDMKNILNIEPPEGAMDIEQKNREWEIPILDR